MTASPIYPQSLLLLVDGEWTAGSGTRRLEVHDPATGEVIGSLPVAERAELDRAIAAVARTFPTWRATPVLERSRLLRRAAEILRRDAETTAAVLTLEQGKPIAEAKAEVASSAEILEWYAEEARRLYGRIIPARLPDVRQTVTPEPIGPVAAFTPWNFPVSQAVRKLGASLAAGCPIILKGAEETPASIIALVSALTEAGIPAGVVNLVFGVPAEISEYLVPHPVIRKVSFTGSVPVGRHLAALAGAHLKPITLELGGHSPAIVFEDADPVTAATTIARFKFRNSGQVCISPNRVFVHRSLADRFTERFVEVAKGIRVGPGSDASSQMGPLANPRRLDAMAGLVADATAKGARVLTGGERLGNQGYFFPPTVLADVPAEARILSEEPFGPVVPILAFDDFDEVVKVANGLGFGLAAYAFTTSAKTAAAIGDAFESGMVSINHFGLATIETPFGGIKDSGHGSEGGSEGIEAYTVPKFVSHALR